MDTPSSEAAAPNRPAPRPVSRWRLFSLRSDQASHEVIDATIRDNARLAGTNLWVLMFAIVIASVGLNVNSTAVIIGAMLISPLMGPIIGIGYGAAIHDYELIRQSSRNLMIFISISLLASTTYFLLTPLTQAYSELLARTSPTIWDVLIAFFGGAAGMIGLTRKEKTTLIPGVAIATALMPPLCTAGYGIATLQPRFFLGAFYLFLINGVFIALASLAIVRILRLPLRSFPDEKARRRGRAVIAVAISLTLVPSVYLAYRLVQEEFFNSAAARFLDTALTDEEDVTLLSRDIDPKARRITVTMIGRGVTPELQAALNGRLKALGPAEASLEIRHPSEERLDISSLKRELQKDVLRSTMVAREKNAAKIAELEGRLAKLKAVSADLSKVESEIRAQLPAAKRVMVTSAPQANTDAGDRRISVLVAIDASRKLPAAEAARLARWLRARMPEAEINVVIGRRYTS
ncbi:MAG: TIGR00341 family protein [Rhodocyclaceae bacterium]